MAHPSIPAPGPATWFAVFAGVVVALITHTVLNLLGIGLGMTSVGPTPVTAANAFNWIAFSWWALAGILAAFAGGYTAGAFANTSAPAQAGVVAFISWATTIVAVMMIVAFSVGGSASVLTNIGGPYSGLLAQLGTGNPSPRAVESLRQMIGQASLASVLALLLGATASVIGGRLAVNGSLARFHLPRFAKTRAENRRSVQ